MSFERQEQVIEQHLLEHYGNNLSTKDTTCLICYPFNSNYVLKQEFRHFWNWIEKFFQAEQCTAYTCTAFDLYLQVISIEADPTHPTERFIRIIVKLILSIRYTERPILRDLIFAL